MKYFLIAAAFLVGCLDENVSPRGSHSARTPMYHGIPICVFQNTSHQNLKVVNVKLYGGQKYGATINFSLHKSSIGDYNSANTMTATTADTVTTTTKNSFLPKLAPQFLGLVAGSDVLTLGQGPSNLILDFGEIYTKQFPFSLKPGEELEMGLYESGIPDDFKGSCDFDWE